MPLFTPTSAGAAWVATTGQAAFPAVQNPSVDVNTQDDYEEGTWTPVDSSGAALTFTSTSGNYIKIGQLVVASCALTYPATADASVATVGGLPFTVQAGITWLGIVSTSVATAFGCRIIGGQTWASIVTSAAAGVTNATLSGALMRLNMVYRASA